MDNKIIDIVKNNFDLAADVKEFIADIEKADEFSAEKVHLQMLLAEVCKSEKAPISIRRQAAIALVRTSDITAAIRNVPGINDIEEEFYQRIRTC